METTKDSSAPASLKEAASKLGLKGIDMADWSPASEFSKDPNESAPEQEGGKYSPLPHSLREEEQLEAMVHDELLSKHRSNGSLKRTDLSEQRADRQTSPLGMAVITNDAKPKEEDSSPLDEIMKEAESEEKAAAQGLVPQKAMITKTTTTTTTTTQTTAKVIAALAPQDPQPETASPETEARERVPAKGAGNPNRFTMYGDMVEAPEHYDDVISGYCEDNAENGPENQPPAPRAIILHAPSPKPSSHAPSAASSHKGKKKKKNFFSIICFCKCARKDQEAEVPPEVEEIPVPRGGGGILMRHGEIAEEAQAPPILLAVKPPMEERKSIEERSASDKELAASDMEHDSARLDQEDEHSEEHVDEERLKRWIVKLKKLVKKQSREKLDLRNELEKARRDAEAARESVAPEEWGQIYDLVFTKTSSTEETISEEEFCAMSTKEKAKALSRALEHAALLSAAAHLHNEAYEGICPSDAWLLEWGHSHLSRQEMNRLERKAQEAYDEVHSNKAIPAPFRENISEEEKRLVRRFAILEQYIKILGQIPETQTDSEKLTCNDLQQEISAVSEENAKYHQLLKELTGI